MARRRNSVLSKYQRSLMIFATAEMIMQGKLRSDIVDKIHQDYGYAIKTINDLICEAQQYASRIFTEDERKLKLRQIAMLYETIMFDDCSDNFSKLKAADQYSKLLKFYQPEVVVNQSVNMNFDKLTDQQLKAIGNILVGEKNDEE